MWIESVLCKWAMTFFLACIFFGLQCSLIETSARVKWDSLIPKGFIFVKVIPRLGVSYSNENKPGRQSSPPLNSAWDNKECVMRPRTNQHNTGSRSPKKIIIRKTHHLHFKTRSLPTRVIIIIIIIKSHDWTLWWQTLDFKSKFSQAQCSCWSA